MQRYLHTVEETIARITAGEPLLLAGDEALLRQLPAGRWIAGTIPYFMAEGGGVVSRDRIFVTVLPEAVESIELREYDALSFRGIYSDIPEDGFGVAILPAGSAIHQAFALEALNYSDFGVHPLVGWISGVHLSELGARKARVFSGAGPTAHEDRGVAMLVRMKAGKTIDVGIINIFHQSQGDQIRFPKAGFEVGEALVNGEPTNFARYLKEKGIDTRLPLVADSSGAQINASFQSVDAEHGTVQLYAPVFADVDYRIAGAVGDYLADFQRELPKESLDDVAFSCNCILNYLYSDLGGKHTSELVGPITFGEIAYQLLNQTLVYLKVVDTA